MLLNIAAIVVAFLLGSIPSAYIIAKLRKGIDIREADYTSNMGAGAVFRQVGRWEGAVVAIADIGKGSAAILAAQAIAGSQLWVLAAGSAAILGHNFPPYIGFRGGQGVDTIIGIFLVLSPKAMGATLVILGIALLVTRHIFTMTAIAAPFLPLFIWVFDGLGMSFYFSLLIIAYVLFRSRHRLKEFRLIPEKTNQQELPEPVHQHKERTSTNERSKIITED